MNSSLFIHFWRFASSFISTTLSKNSFRKEVLKALPKEELRMGARKETYAAYEPLDLPDCKELMIQKGDNESCMKAVGKYCSKVIEM